MADTATQQAPTSQATPKNIKKKIPAKNPIKTPKAAEESPEMPGKIEEAPSQAADTGQYFLTPSLPVYEYVTETCFYDNY